jgi:NAD(P)H-dependent FMN reductase
VAKAYLEILGNQEAEAQLLDLADLPREIAFSECFGERTDSFQQNFIRLVEKSEKFIFIIPEYNGGFPGILKLFLDAIPPKAFHYKKAALVGISSGSAGALRPMDQFSNVLNYLKVNVLSDKPKLSAIEEALGKDGELVNELYLKRLTLQAEHFMDF